MTQAVAPSLQQIPGTWDAVAPTYAEEAPQWMAFAEEAVRRTPLTRADHVLEIAAGPGQLTFLAATKVARVSAVDFSPGMIDVVRARAAKEGVTNVDATAMDAQSLAFPDATFDAAFCMFGFMFFPDRARAFREMLRVLQPGGRALIATWSPIDRRPFMQIGFDAMAEALPQFPRPTKGDLQSPAECEQEMSAAGFRDVVAQPFATSVRVESPERYLEILVRTGAPFAVMRKRLGEEAWGAAMGRMLDALKKRIPKDGVELAAEAILTHGVR